MEVRNVRVCRLPGKAIRRDKSNGVSHAFETMAQVTEISFHRAVESMNGIVSFCAIEPC